MSSVARQRSGGRGHKVAELTRLVGWEAQHSQPTHSDVVRRMPHSCIGGHGTKTFAWVPPAGIGG